MAKENGKSREPIELVVQELRKLNEKFDLVREDLGAINHRLDKVIENTGTHWRDLERRVASIEQQLGGKPSR